jgi:hypothetical protein
MKMTNERTPELDKSFIALENNLPSMPEIRGTLEAWKTEYPGTVPTTRYVLTLLPGFDAPKRWELASYVLDDGESLQLFYVAGYSDPATTPYKAWRLYLDPVSAGSSRYRGPAKTYFLTVAPLQ